MAILTIILKVISGKAIIMTIAIIPILIPIHSNDVMVSQPTYRRSRFSRILGACLSHTLTAKIVDPEPEGPQRTP